MALLIRSLRRKLRGTKRKIKSKNIDRNKSGNENENLQNTN
jgi:hypothetical protein